MREETQATAAERDPLFNDSIGLALSGGGFRASIFHLGVILRLEELEIMPKIAVISAVSGGSIIGAYYAYAMEDQLRRLPPEKWNKVEFRLEAYKTVAKEFLLKVRLNMRSRALLFSPWYHPWLFAKAVALRPFRDHAFSILIQKEFDRHFYHDYTLDQLPAVQPDKERSDREGRPVLTGPRLLLNTTSLMTGERKAFSRDANTYLAQLNSSNKNVLKLSRVVGASSGVPLVFPPTSIFGELLVDGGVSDNQGIEGLLPSPEQYSPKKGKHAVKHAKKDCPPPDDYVPVGTLLISDACGQLEPKDTLSTDGLSVYSRVNDILMHQVRNKLLALLASVHEAGHIRFAFVHLLLNLADGGIEKRVPSEFVEPLGRIRTDLDQFSYVEAEALMYHGYTLIDAMIKRWCDEKSGGKPLPEHDVPLRTAPLFLKAVRENPEAIKLIRDELVAGDQQVFLFRCFNKFGLKGVWLPYGIAAAIWLAIVVCFFVFPKLVVDPSTRWWQNWLMKFKLPIPGVDQALKMIVDGAAIIAGILTTLLLPAYVVVYFLWAFMRRLALALDRKLYESLTGRADPEALDWPVEEDVLPESNTAATD
jgi:predicted acylesterase/phospholipase RssA